MDGEDDEWGDGGWSDDEKTECNSEFSIFEKFIIEEDYWSIFQNRADLSKFDKDEKKKLSQLFHPDDQSGRSRKETGSDAYIAYLLCSGFVCQTKKDMNGRSLLGRISNTI